MPINYLKHADKTASTGEQDVRKTVQTVLDEIEVGGDDKAREYAAKFDKWTGDIVVSKEDMKAAADKVSTQLKDDIRFAHDQVRKFAEAQRDSLRLNCVRA